MFLFILESIGTSELILIGIVALIFLGPRRLPEIARKIGKIMADFRNTTNEFKSTWEREVDFEEEAKALRLDAIEEEASQPVPRENSILPEKPAAEIEAPAVREISPDDFEAVKAPTPDEMPSNGSHETSEPESVDEADTLSDKRSWL